MGVPRDAGAGVVGRSAGRAQPRVPSQAAATADASVAGPPLNASGGGAGQFADAASLAQVGSSHVLFGRVVGTGSLLR